MTKVEKVNLIEPVSVSAIRIHKYPFFKNTYVIEFPLDSVPNFVWQTLFEQEMVSSLRFWDRKVVFVGQKLQLITTPENIEEKVEWLKEIIESTNRRVEEYNRNEQLRKKLKEEEKTDLEAIRKIEERLRQTFSIR